MLTARLSTWDASSTSLRHMLLSFFFPSSFACANPILEKRPLEKPCACTINPPWQAHPSAVVHKRFGTTTFTRVKVIEKTFFPHVAEHVDIGTDAAGDLWRPCGRHSNAGGREGSI